MSKSFDLPDWFNDLEQVQEYLIRILKQSLKDSHKRELLKLRESIHPTQAIKTPQVKFIVCSTSDDGYDSFYQEFYSELEATEAAKEAAHEYSSEVIMYEISKKTVFKS